MRNLVEYHVGVSVELHEGIQILGSANNQSSITKEAPRHENTSETFAINRHLRSPLWPSFYTIFPWLGSGCLWAPSAVLANMALCDTLQLLFDTLESGGNSTDYISVIVDIDGTPVGRVNYAFYVTHSGDAELDSEWPLFSIQHGKKDRRRDNAMSVERWSFINPKSYYAFDLGNGRLDVLFGSGPLFCVFRTQGIRSCFDKS